MYKRLFYKFLFAYLNQQIPRREYQLLKLGDHFVCSLDSNHDIQKKLVSSTGSCGASKIPELAKIKAISEFVEREAFRNTDASSSCGFAAYPYIFNKALATKNAKVEAMNERIEKYAWTRWADQENIKSKIHNIPYEENKNYYLGIQQEIKFLEYYRITPLISNISNLNCTLLYALTQYGWVCGASAKHSPIEAENNALKELYMSSIALYRNHEKQMEPSSFFEKRLLWISQQDHLIRSKITCKGEHLIQIPKHYFRNIETKYKKFYVVQQCYLEGYKCNFFGDETNKLYI
jgi:hypothetical protein